MSLPGQPDAASKARTIAHMNKDHQTDLLHILQHFNPGTASDVSSEDIEMVDMGLDSITVLVKKQQNKEHVIKLNPPMADWGDRRQRLIDMTMAARAGLGIVSEDSDDNNHGNRHQYAKNNLLYRRPRGAGLVVFSAVTFYFACYAALKAGYVEPGTLVWSLLAQLGALTGVDGLAEGFRWLTETIFVPVLGIHVAEGWWFDRSRMSLLEKSHGVARGRSLVWWLWIGNVALEGVTAFQRFDAMVDELGIKRE